VSVSEVFEVMTQVDHDLTLVNKFDRQLRLIKNLGRHKVVTAVEAAATTSSLTVQLRQMLPPLHREGELGVPWWLRLRAARVTTPSEIIPYNHLNHFIWSLSDNKESSR
jgi:hypothetical protein